MTDLADRHCQERPKGSPALAAADVERYRGQLDPAWTVAGDHLERTVRFPETTAAGEPITSYASSSVGAGAYRALAR